MAGDGESPNILFNDDAIISESQAAVAQAENVVDQTLLVLQQQTDQQAQSMVVGE